MTAAADRLRFGTAGVPETAQETSSLAAVSRMRDIGLDALEIEFVRGVKIGSETAAKIRDKARALDIRLSAHAPYYINLASPEQSIRLQSRDHLVRAARMGRLAGVESVVFHAGYYGSGGPETAYPRVRSELREILSLLQSERNPVALRIETMGKSSQFGTLDEVLTLCQDVEGLAPCLDFSHLHAREGGHNTFREFQRIYRKVARRLGRGALDNAHIHLSGIEYGAKGELRHLNLEDSDFRYDQWIEATKEAEVGGRVICESPGREADAVLLKRQYAAYSEKYSSDAPSPPAGDDDLGNILRPFIGRGDGGGRPPGQNVHGRARCGR